jgi:predicted acetyltransferase
MLQFKVAETMEEYREAIALAVKVFEPNAEIENFASFKQVLWCGDPEFSLGNLILAVDASGVTCGVIRVVPRILMRGDQCFNMAGISSVCLATKYRGQGYSVPFMRYALNLCADRGYDLSLLFARRALDGYYNRFGYWGISSYNKVSFVVPKEKGCGRGADVELGEFSFEEIEMYNHYYDACYSNSFGYIRRSLKHWDLIGKRLTALGGISFKTLIKQGKVEGFIVLDQSNVVEIATNIDSLGIVDIIELLRRSSIYGENSNITFEVSPDHALLQQASSGLDRAISFRSCSYGGHMVKILNVEHACSLWQIRLKNLYSEIGVEHFDREVGRFRVCWNGRSVDVKGLGNYDLDYETTCLLLGCVRSDAVISSNIGMIDRVPFNVSFLDHL